MDKKVKWYEKKEWWTVISLSLGAVKYFSQPHTLAYQIADYGVTVAVPILTGIVGVEVSSKKFDAPSGLSKAYDKTKDKMKSVVFRK